MKFKFLIISLLFFFFGQAFAQKSILLWDSYNEKYGKQVTLTPYLAENNDTGLAIIVCPGGSYFWLDKKYEGKEVAQWLQQNGISAFVLHYRTGGVGAFLWYYRNFFQGKQHPDMIKDAQRSLQWVREHAEEYHIDPKKVGMMGFSAGGHLVMMTACFNQTDFLENNDTNLRPDFVVPIYPVVTMSEPCVHKRSRRALLGEKRQNDTVMCDSLSLERHIPRNCPPVFLVNCVDDPVVDYYNSILLDSALTANKVEHRYLQYQTGGHGFGVNAEKGTVESRQWKQEFLDWVRSLNLWSPKHIEEPSYQQLNN